MSKNDTDDEILLNSGSATSISALCCRYQASTRLIRWMPIPEEYLSFHRPRLLTSLWRKKARRAGCLTCPRGIPVEDNTTFQAAIRYATGIYYPRIADAPTSAFIAARKVLSPGFFEKRLVPVQQPGAPEKPYRQRSLLTKQRTRLTRLRTRILQKTPLFFFEEYQAKLVENPEYYGVCIIEGICNVNPGQRLGWLAQERAIQRENEMRAQGLS